MGKITDTTAPAHPVDVHVGAKMRLARRERRMSQQTLAEACGVTFQQIQKYERAANRVSCSALVKMAAALDIKPGWFLDDAPGAPSALPARDGWTEAQDMVASTPGALEVLRCLSAMGHEVRAPMIEVMQHAAGRRPPKPAAVAA